MNSRSAALHEHIHWKPRVVIVPTLSSQMAQLQLVFVTACSGISDDEVGIMTTLGFQYYLNIFALVDVRNVNRITQNGFTKEFV